MKITLKSALIVSASFLVAVAAAGYVFVFGFTYSNSVKPGVYTIHSENPLSRIGANIVAFDTGSKWVLVDTHLGPLAESARAKLKSIKDQPVALAFNTHWHPDHSGGNATFTEEAQIIAHKNVLEILSGPHAATGLTSPGSGHSYDAASTANLPEATVSDSQTFTQDNKGFAAVHFPNAHTNGDLTIFAHSFNVVALGDLIWPGAFPYVDIQNGGNAAGILFALEKTLEATNQNTIFIAGHGKPLTRNQVRTYEAMLRGTISHVSNLRSEGLSLEEIQANGLPKQWHGWASDLVPESEWIRMIAVGLS